MTQGIDAARAVADKLRTDKETREKTDQQGLAEVKSQLAQIESNSDLAQMYRESAQVGSENLGGSLPTLKIHMTGKSHTNELSNGKEPVDGNFFYKPTGEEFTTIDAHILTISRGFYDISLEDKNKKVFTQLVGGVFGADYKPFIMYFTSKKLNPMWEFAKIAGKYTHAKPIGIPLFVLTVQLSTHREKNSVGYSWIPDFELVKETDGSPKLVLDMGEFTFLKNMVDDIQDMIASIIERKEVTDQKPSQAIPVEEEVIQGE